MSTTANGGSNILGPTLGRATEVRLQDLIKSRKREIGRARGRDLTYEEMVARAADAGHPISRSMLHHLAGDEWPNVPTTDKILALAAALDLDPDEILAAAAESLGLQTKVVEVPPFARAMIALVEGRTAEQQKLLADVVRSLANAMDATPDAAPDAAPDNQDGAPTSSDASHDGGVPAHLSALRIPRYWANRFP